MTNGLNFGLSDVKDYVSAIECMASFRSDVKLQLSKDGIRSTTIDSNHVVLIDLFMSSRDMSSVDVSEGVGDLYFNADMKVLGTMLKPATKRGDVILVKKPDTDSLQIMFQGSEYVVQPRQCFVSNVESELEIPKHNPDATLQLTCKEAKRLLKEMITFGEDLEVSFDYTKQEFSFNSQGKGGWARTMLQMDSPGVNNLHGSKDIKLQRYDAKLLEKIIKVNTGAKEVEINFVQEFPLCVTHRIKDHGYIRFYLAPKFE